jgi:uncharacterized protein YdeI (YjbR/CyaY-like superfamily)
MSTRDPRVDAYIARAAPFARPILEFIRECVHAASDDISETMKWSFPHFEHQGIVCSMAAFKEHCALNLWKAPLLFPELPPEKNSMGHMGRLTAVSDLPPRKELVAILKKAVKLNDAGVKVERARPPKTVIAPPDDLVSALKRNRTAGKTFEAFSPSQRREYVEWINEAKSEATRQRRLEQALEWMAEGKPRNWKYMKK